MFESLKHWFEALDKDDERVFNHADDQVLHVALASLLFHIISADRIESPKERQLFAEILKDECGLDDEQARHLYARAKSLGSSVHDDLETINHYLKDNPMLRQRFMEKLNRLIDIDWVKESELEAFNEALRVFFPDIRND